jgi:hypothetical protein
VDSEQERSISIVGVWWLRDQPQLEHSIERVIVELLVSEEDMSGGVEDGLGFEEVLERECGSGLELK